MTILEVPPRLRPELTGGPTEPWISRDAIDRLDELLRPEMIAIEWGSGASTLWYASRVKEVHTIEHDDAWAQRLRTHLGVFKKGKIFLHHVPPTLRGSEEYMGVGGKYYEDYSSAPGAPDKADAIFVDGRARNACLRTAVRKLTRGGILVLDDASRSRYDTSVVPEAWALELYYNEVYSTKIWLAE